MINDVLFQLTGENDIPVHCLSLDRAGLHLTHWRASFLACGELDFDRANFGETHPLILGQRKTRLWKRETLIAPITLEARIARRFPLFDPTKERVVSLIHTSQNIL